jgi:DivIVA domain-containing protein
MSKWHWNIAVLTSYFNFRLVEIKTMGNNEIVNRNAILGDTQDFGFDKALRGYDTKQVDEYIENLLAINKNASEMFDQRYDDLKNQNSMLEYELNQAKSELKEMTKLFEKCREERDELKQSQQTATAVVDSVELDEYKQKCTSLANKNKLLAEENKKLEDKNRDLQRDVAHLTKKVDKNRTEIKNLKDELEAGMTAESEKKYAEIAQVYQGAVDKAEDLIYRLQTELSLAHSKAEDISAQ